jgi:hypothetical protein
MGLQIAYVKMGVEKKQHISVTQFFKDFIDKIAASLNLLLTKWLINVF